VPQPYSAKHTDKSDSIWTTFFFINRELSRVKRWTSNKTSQLKLGLFAEF